MKKRIAYSNEPILIGRRVGPEILPGHGGARPGAGRPRSGNQAVTVRLPPKLVDRIRREARKAGQSISEYVASRLSRG